MFSHSLLIIICSITHLHSILNNIFILFHITVVYLINIMACDIYRDSLIAPDFQLYSRFKKNPQWIHYSYCEPRILMYTKFSWKNKNERRFITFFKIIDYMWQHLYKNINNLYLNRYFRYKITYFLKNLKCSVFIIFPIMDLFKKIFIIQYENCLFLT